MANCLDEACHLSTDPQEGPSITVVATSATGKPGRPRKEIDPAFLEEALSLHGPSGLSGVLDCHPRAICRQLGLATPGQPVVNTGPRINPMINPAMFDGNSSTTWCLIANTSTVLQSVQVRTCHREFWVLELVACSFADVKAQAEEFIWAIGEPIIMTKLEHYKFIFPNQSCSLTLPYNTVA
ncbi:hypothetical protein C8R46DRAFT_1050316 [Mycena filopes]|nr:hypothetical protein C8R46DRAFT_1050316 [Mycena filopes]